MRWIVLGAGLVAACPMTALGCLNDSESVVTEHEFRSRYGSGAPSGDGVQEESGPALWRVREWNAGGVGAAVGGILLIAGAVETKRRRGMR